MTVRCCGWRQNNKLSITCKYAYILWSVCVCVWEREREIKRAVASAQLMISGCMGTFPRYNFHTFVWKLLSLPLSIWYMGSYPWVGTCPGYYGSPLMPVLMHGGIMRQWILPQHRTWKLISFDHPNFHRLSRTVQSHLILQWFVLLTLSFYFYNYSIVAIM